MAEPPTLVVGSRGLLGAAVVRELRRRGTPVLTVSVPWAEPDPDTVVRALDEGAGRLLADGVPWRVAWCAGAGVVGTPECELDTELEVLAGFLGRLGDRLADPSAPAGALFLASSAGGVYAGAEDPPFTEHTEPRAISPYGVAKLAAEDLVADFGRRTGTATVVGRIANLYGPGQDVSKPQGLISQLCLNQLRRRPISIYVSLDTARDYLFVDDCAAMVLDTLDHAAAAGGRHTKILASGQATTLASLLGVLKQVTKRSPQLVLGASPLARFQTKGLRFRSVVPPDLRSRAGTTLAAGVAATMESLGQDLRRGGPTCLGERRPRT